MKMKLTKCDFSGILGFGTLSLDALEILTSFTGPNGSGKSSILKTIQLACEILSVNSLHATLPVHDPRFRFDKAKLEFSNDGLFESNHFQGHLNGHEGALVVDIRVEYNNFRITKVSRGDASIIFGDSQRSEEVVQEVHNELKSTEQTIRELESRIIQIKKNPALNVTKRVAPQINELQHAQASLRNAQTQLAEKQGQVNRINVITVQLTSPANEIQVTRAEVSAFLESLMFPAIKFIGPNQAFGNVVPDLIEKLLRLKKGPRPENRQFWEASDRLETLLQSAVDIYEDSGVPAMKVNDTPYGKTSTGTQTALSFFALTNSAEPNSLVLWDEPENGLHPTRRVKLLELMCGDSRQFILATHAPEFAPISIPEGKVFRCDSIYDSNEDSSNLTVKHVADRREAFSALEALGVYPARVLFTANVIIWVEGPTELLFFRHWLKPILSGKGVQEGFHYTFMQYGGALINYLEVADAGEVESTFDLLSVCRHPVIVVDSDLRAPIANGKTPSEFLKTGAVRILKQVQELNNSRPNGALFEFTSGKEIENYMPEEAIWHAVEVVWKGFANHSANLKSGSFSIGQFEPYDAALARHFVSCGVVESPQEGKDGLPMGRTCWGVTNKVQMMRNALSFPGLKEEQLKWDCSSLLHRIANFVIDKLGDSAAVMR